MCIQQYLQGLNCEDVPGTSTSFLVEDRSVDCNSKFYLNRVFPLALTMLLVYGNIFLSIDCLYYFSFQVMNDLFYC